MLRLVIHAPRVNLLSNDLYFHTLGARCLTATTEMILDVIERLIGHSVKVLFLFNIVLIGCLFLVLF